MSDLDSILPQPLRKKLTYLLQLLVLQVTPHHHLQHNEQLPVTDVPVSIDIVYFESKPQFFLLVTFAAECGKTGDEFLEIDIAATVFVEDGYHPAKGDEKRNWNVVEEM